MAYFRCKSDTQKIKGVEIIIRNPNTNAACGRIVLNISHDGKISPVSGTVADLSGGYFNYKFTVTAIK